MTDKYQKIIDDLGKENIFLDEPLSNHSHIKIGGPADLFFVAKTKDELIKSVQSAIKNDVPFTILGWGSNALISDEGIRGLVIKNKYKELEIVKEIDSLDHPVPQDGTPLLLKGGETKDDARQVEWNLEKTGLYDFRDLDYVETGVSEVLVRVSSGYDLPAFIIQTINQGITGMQWFAGIPGTMAGAIYNNIHGGKKLIGPYVVSATIINGETGELREVRPEYFGFAYDESQMHANKDVLIDITMRLKRGDVERAKYVRTEWAKRKSIQPQNSLGCTFANPPEDVSKSVGYDSPSIGYFVEQVLGWTEKEYIGGVSMGRGNGHAAFICNENSATAQDYIDMMVRIKKEYFDRTKFELRPEIFFLGEFENNPFKSKK